MKAYTSPYSSLFAAWLLLALSNSKTGATTCSGEEDTLEFTFFLDEDSLEENGWSLICDGLGTVWDIPVGTIGSTFHFQDPETPYITQQVCIGHDTFCNFTLQDNFGNGILDPGYFYLTYGATTLMVSTEGEEFLEKISCLGPGCTIVPQELAEQCDDFYLSFEANDTPQQNSVRVECEGETIFAKSDFQEPQESTTFSQCIPSYKCCNIIVNNTGNRSLQGVGLEVEWAGHVLLSYDATTRNQDVPSSIQQPFGATCQAPPTEKPIETVNATSTPAIQNTTTDTASPVIQNSTTTTTKRPSTQSTATNTQEAKSMQSSTFKDSGGFIALMVGACLVVVGLLVALLSCHSPSSQTVRGGKDLDVRSTGSKETDSDDEV